MGLHYHSPCWFCNLRVQSCFAAESMLQSVSLSRLRGWEPLNSEVVQPPRHHLQPLAVLREPGRNQQSQFVTQTPTSSQSATQIRHVFHRPSIKYSLTPRAGTFSLNEGDHHVPCEVYGRLEITKNVFIYILNIPSVALSATFLFRGS